WSPRRPRSPPSSGRCAHESARGGNRVLSHGGRQWRGRLAARDAAGGARAPRPCLLRGGPRPPRKRLAPDPPPGGEPPPARRGRPRVGGAPPRAVGGGRAPVSGRESLAAPPAHSALPHGPPPLPAGGRLRGQGGHPPALVTTLHGTDVTAVGDNGARTQVRD